ncbi:MAG: MFS transporter [Pantoea sp.]|uniref:MFS transporter n=2 Tax=Erwiniaceae TaxID=1903409 RepID=UPI0006611D1E|nr:MULTISPECIES: MFS transporter [Pantoea]MBS6436917.1 MFS transporter [Pantoea sp.]MDU2728045.1 MFS transporter [Pantoea sp.]MDU5474254.1 MFS transporter [Pantoea sp.]MDU6078251.1 MFS transporter [Pantoea sp.]MDU7837140.1 MFS transporter [Pantoea sp.]
MARRNPYAQREWLPHEKPMLPGSPSTPIHSPPKRIAFGLIGLLISLTGALSNALVTANLTNLQGTFGAYSNEIAWLPAVYVMGNISINLLLVKFRQQFGLRVFTEAFLVLYVLVAFFHLFANDLSSAIIVRTAHGMAGAALSSLGIYYQVQAWPAKHRLKALVIGLTVSQFAIPMARLFSSELLQLEEWRGLYLFELGLAMIALGCVLVVKLPPGDRIKAFEKLDFVTFMLLAPGMALLCGVLSLGRIEWWFTTPWLGVCLAIALVLIVAAIVIEHNRKNPLINTRWLSSGNMVRLGIVMIMIRIVLAEQNTGAVGFLQQLGLLNDQMRGLSLAIIGGMTLGIAISALTIRPAHLNWPIVTSLAVMIVASLMDAQASPVTRANNMYLSQFLLGFSSTFFMAPAMLIGIGSVVTQPKNLVSFVVLFGMSQNLGGLIGSAILGTFQVWREKYHSSLIGDQLSLLDPNVTERLSQYGALFNSQLADPALLSAQSTSQLQVVATLQANVLAYNDTYLLTAALALITLMWALWRLSRQRYLNWRQARFNLMEQRLAAASQESMESR